MARDPLSETIITALARLVNDSQEEGRRDPSHSDLDFCFKRADLTRADPKAMGQVVGKSKRVRPVLSWATDGELRPLVLDNLSDKELTMALRAYVRRERRGAVDAGLLVGTGKDLLEAVAKHVLDIV